MFGQNQITGQKYFQNAAPGTLFVTSIFYTLQGEGPYAGRPAVFVRLAKCNLACSFCDTFFDAGDWLSYVDVLDQIDRAIREHTPLHPDKIGLVITGGEPLLQANLAQFLAECVDSFGWVQVETNGTVLQDLDPLVTVVCSPKCVERDGIAERYLKPAGWMLKRADCLKFVMRSTEASLNLGQWGKFDPYAEVPLWAHQWAHDRGLPVYVSPMNIYNDIPKASKAMRWVGKEAALMPDLHMRSTVDEVVSFWEPGLLNMEANERNHRYAAEYCKRYGFRFNLQMHLYAGLA